MDIWAIAAAAAAAVSAGISGDAAVRAEKSCEYLQAAPLAHLPLHRRLSFTTILECTVRHVSDSKKTYSNKPLQSKQDASIHVILLFPSKR
jgi:hypothetical protein